MEARERFELTRRYVEELNNVKALIMSGGEDWKPPEVKTKGKSDPTANRAIYNVDELGERLAELRRREGELESFIGVSLVVVDGVRRGLGEKYADVLEWHYIDLMTWPQINEEHGVPRSSAQHRACIAFDWIDSVGVSNLLNHVYEV